MPIFAKTMAERVISVNSGFKSYHPVPPVPQQIPEAKMAILKSCIAHYDFCCQKYGGLGFVTSFVPGTEAFLAREFLSELVDEYLNDLRKELTSIPQKEYGADWYKARNDMASLRGVTSWAALEESLRKVVDETRGTYQFDLTFSYSYFTEHQRNKKIPFIVLLSYFPLISNLFYHFSNDSEIMLKRMGGAQDRDEDQGGYRDEVIRISSIIHDILNPVLLLQQAWYFLNLIINRALEIGGKRDDYSKIRGGLKFFVAGVFAIVALPLAVVGIIADLPYKMLKHLVYNPLKFIISSIKKKNDGMDEVFLKTQDMQNIEQLVNQVKEEKQSEPSLSTTKILGFISLASASQEPKKKQETQPEEFSTAKMGQYKLFRVTSSQKTQICQLLSIVQDQSKQPAQKITAAQSILGLKK